MEDKLQEIHDLKKELDKFNGKEATSYAIWSLWKWMAQDQPWFDDFQHDERIPFAELKPLRAGSSDVISKMISREHGEKLWRERKNILHQIELIEKRLLLKISEARDEGAIYKQISKAYGGTLGAVMHFVRRKTEKYGEIS